MKASKYDAEKVRRELAKHKMTRTDKEVYDGTSAKETRSMLIMDDNTIRISSVNASVLETERILPLAKKNPRTNIDDEKRGATRHLFYVLYAYKKLQFNTQNSKICV